MRRLTFAVLGVAAVACAIRATGFPSRIGLTRSQAALSLPGDLLAPGADVVVDRAIVVHAHPQAVWQVIETAFHAHGDDVIASEEEDCLILRVPLPGLDHDDDRSGVCTLALLPEANGTTRIHLRERHTSTPDVPAWRLRTLLAAESASAMLMLRDIKAAAQAM
ncbi:hypothetical protein [Schaalia suimastitidis]|uniref:hypothetical protein n=1 Tax=Schaalia suimastitidis TaxID=121163 RepID=UPI0003F4FF61|nr:hypothetical protein [Schaalia suimastitidis]